MIIRILQDAGLLPYAGDQPVSSVLPSGGVAEFLAEFRISEFDPPVLFLLAAISFCVLFIGYAAGSRLRYSYILRRSRFAEKALLESERRYRSLFDITHAVMLFIDPESGALIDANPAASRYYGYTRKQLKRMTIYDITEGGQDAVHTGLSSSLTGASQKFTCRQTLANGESRDVELLGSPVAEDSASVLFFIVNDITERGRYEASLREVTESLEQLIACANVPILVWNPDLVIMKCNRAFEKMTGYSAGEMLGRKIDMIFPQRVHDLLWYLIDRNEHGEFWETVEIPILHMNGSMKTVMWNTGNVYDSSGRITATIAQGVDITERKKFEGANRRLSKIVEKSLNEIYVFRKSDFRFTYMNAAARENLGLREEDIMSMTPLDISAYMTMEDFAAVLDPLLSGTEKIVHFESVNRRKDGSEYDVLVYLERHYDYEDELFAAIALDISESKAVKENNRLNEARLESLLKISQYRADGIQDLLDYTLEEAIYLTGSRIGYIYFYNEKSGDLVLNTWSRDQDSQPFHENLEAGNEIGDTGIWIQTVISRQPVVLNGIHTEKVSCMHLERVLAIPVFNDEKIVAVVGVANKRADYNQTDIRQLQLLMDGVWKIKTKHETELEIRRLNTDLENRVADRTAQLQAANRELEAFAYSVSHDLRAPLRAIDGFSQALIEDYEQQLDDEARRYLQRIKSSSGKMAMLIDDLLNLSRVTRLTLRKERVNLTAIASCIFDELSADGSDRSVMFSVEPEIQVCADNQLLSIAMRNLLANAWKFTARKQAPSIEVGSKIDDGRIVYYVKDNGAGFDSKYKNKLFGAFQRLHSNDEFQGTGIGLSIVQRIIHRHGGAIWADGEVDAGAVFYFTLQDDCPLDTDKIQ